MSIVDGNNLIEVRGCLFEPDSDLLRRLTWATAQIGAEGGTLYWTEAGRPVGVPSDANVRSSSQTASGRSTVWFQWGRYLRGETPSAADPRTGPLASEHTRGIAIDCNAPTQRDAELRAKYFRLVGLENTVSSESWHWAIRGPVLVDLGSTPAPGRTQKGKYMDVQNIRPFRGQPAANVLIQEGADDRVVNDQEAAVLHELHGTPPADQLRVVDENVYDVSRNARGVAVIGG